MALKRIGLSRHDPAFPVIIPFFCLLHIGGFSARAPERSKLVPSTARKSRAVRGRALTIFLELAHSRSIRQVSQRLDLAPTAIIRLIDQIEHHFQTSLFDRSGGGIRLTEAGTLLAEHAPSIVADLQTTRSLIDDLRQLKTHCPPKSRTRYRFSIRSFRFSFEDRT